MPGWQNLGICSGLKNQCPYGIGGSSPLPGTSEGRIPLFWMIANKTAAGQFYWISPIFITAFSKRHTQQFFYW